MTKPRLTEDELTRLRILAAYEIYQVLRNHQVDDVGRTCIDLAERAVKAFAEWAPGDEAEAGEIEWVAQGEGSYRAVTRSGVFRLRVTGVSLLGAHWGLYQGGNLVKGFYPASAAQAKSQANGWIERKYGKDWHEG